MTTLEPGASVVLTHGLLDRPLSTALRASRAAPIMTCGFEVLVQEVIAAITTAPWSSPYSVPFSSVTRTGCETRPLAPAAADSYSRGASSGSALTWLAGGGLDREG